MPPDSSVQPAARARMNRTRRSATSVKLWPSIRMTVAAITTRAAPAGDERGAPGHVGHRDRHEQRDKQRDGLSRAELADAEPSGLVPVAVRARRGRAVGRGGHEPVSGERVRGAACGGHGGSGRRGGGACGARGRAGGRAGGRGGRRPGSDPVAPVGAAAAPDPARRVPPRLPPAGLGVGGGVGVGPGPGRAPPGAAPGGPPGAGPPGTGPPENGPPGVAPGGAVPGPLVVIDRTCGAAQHGQRRGPGGARRRAPRTPRSRCSSAPG